MKVSDARSIGAAAGPRSEAGDPTIESRAGIALDGSTTAPYRRQPVAGRARVEESRGSIRDPIRYPIMGRFWASLDSSDFLAVRSWRLSPPIFYPAISLFRLCFRRATLPGISARRAKRRSARPYLSCSGFINSLGSCRRQPTPLRVRRAKIVPNVNRSTWPSLPGRSPDPPRRSCRTCRSPFSWALPNRGTCEIGRNRQRHMSERPTSRQ